MYTEINNDRLFYDKCTDDIFFTYTRGETKLNKFLSNSNMIQDSIKFDHEAQPNFWYFSLVSLFYGISTFIGYLMQEPSF